MVSTLLATTLPSSVVNQGFPILSFIVAMPARAFNGFCGETSHHTRSSSSRLNASILMWRWPS